MEGPPPDGVFMDTFVGYTHTTGGERDGDRARGGGRHCGDTHRTDVFTLAAGTAKPLAKRHQGTELLGTRGVAGALVPRPAAGAVVPEGERPPCSARDARWHLGTAA